MKLNNYIWNFTFCVSKQLEASRVTKSYTLVKHELNGFGNFYGNPYIDYEYRGNTVHYLLSKLFANIGLPYTLELIDVNCDINFKKGTI